VSIVLTDYPTVEGLLHHDVISKGLQADFIKAARLMENFGAFKSATKGIGFNVNILNGVTTVKLNYNLTFEKCTATEHLELQSSGGKPFRITSFSFQNMVRWWYSSHGELRMEGKLLESFKGLDIISSCKAFGPYLNFYFVYFLIEK